MNMTQPGGMLFQSNFMSMKPGLNSTNRSQNNKNSTSKSDNKTHSSGGYSGNAFNAHNIFTLNGFGYTGLPLTQQYRGMANMDHFKNLDSEAQTPKSGSKISQIFRSESKEPQEL